MGMASKQTIRRDLRRRRGALAAASVAATAELVRGLVENAGLLSHADALFAYAATENEVDTRPLIDRADEIGLAVALPRIIGSPPAREDRMSFVRHRRGDALAAGAWGIPTPLGGEELIPCRGSVVLLPLVAFDACGHRLGRGGGWYDRTAKLWPSSTLRVGLGYEFQLLRELPFDEWDVPLHLVVTERRVVVFDVPEEFAFLRKEEADRNGISVDGNHQHRIGGRVRLVDRQAAKPAA